MISQQTAQILQNQMQRTGRSLLQYTTESFPYTRNARETEIVAKLHEMAKEESDRNATLAKFLRSNRYSAPHFGAFPMDFTTMNYLAVDRVLHLLVQYQTEDIGHLELAIREVKEPEAKELLRSLLDSKQAHLKAFEELMAQPATNGVQESSDVEVAPESAGHFESAGHSEQPTH